MLADVKYNESLRKQIFQVIENQMKNNDPPETKITYARLHNHGYSALEAKQLIGQCLIVELFDVIKNKKPFDETRYVRNLQQLPKKPLDNYS